MRWTLLQAAHTVAFHTLLRFPIWIGACSKLPTQTKPWNQKTEDSWVLTETFSRAVHHIASTTDWLHRCFIWLFSSAYRPWLENTSIPRGRRNLRQHLQASLRQSPAASLTWEVSWLSPALRSPNQLPWPEHYVARRRLPSGCSQEPVAKIIG